MIEFDAKDNHKNVKILSAYPFGIVYGGLEIQCLKTYEALKQIGVKVSFLDYHELDTKIDILHFFGTPPGFYELCHYGKKKVIISAVTGGWFGNSKIKRVIKTVWRINDTICSFSRQKTDYWRLKFIFRYASKVICLNELEKKFIGYMYNIPDNRLTIIPNGVDNIFFSANKELFTKKYKIKDFVLFTGSITKRKNPMNLALALSDLNINGVFLGKTYDSEKKYGSQFENIIKNNSNLFWIKDLDHDNPLLASSYAAAKVLCLPSELETQSLSALEAMATGTPVILGDRPYAYQEPFQHSEKCNPTNIESIKKSITKVISNSKQYTIKLPEKYRWTNVALKVAELYEKIA